MNRFGPNELLKCYRRGVFPMAESRDSSEVFLIEPVQRGIIPLHALHISRSLRKKIRQCVFQVTINHCFEDVLLACAQPRPGCQDTWINKTIESLYNQLHTSGHAHSVECWYDNLLVGGLYGVSLGGAFFGESMFSKKTDASKFALVHLVARLKAGGYTLLDTQFITDHLRSLGAVTLSCEAYKTELSRALEHTGDFFSLAKHVEGVQILQSITQTS